MNRLDQTRLIVNQPLDETHTKQEYEFVDEQSFLTWFEIEKNRFGWISNGTYPGTRKSMSGSIQSARYNTEWSRVYYNGNHINHQPDSLESWQRRRLSPVLRNWLKDVVAAGINWEAFKVLAIPNQETLDTLNSGRLRSDEAIRISEMLRINSDDFYNFRRSHRKTLAQYDTDCWKSLLLHSDQKKCNEIPTELAMTFVSHTNDPESCDELGKEILVKSLTKENVQYSVLLNEDGLISRCTCDYMSKSLVVCKHMYLAARVLGYTISFDIRETEASCNELLPTPQLSSVEGDPKNILSADFRQVIQRVEDVVDDYNNLEEQDQALCQDALDKLRAVSAIRNRANRQIAWSERQRR
ncbi:hypothetical protein OnM2_052080 [Erysiphe neolycopersici]|uniref:SWIM-type domain-containing protein n=1 Tax=Erysiphe neolycopersici TaxID=212602 RepID=A0A420HS47_9PEZI|nr:hypothetical protein OnM2_052080 [Erysiphe neolycopersici]